VYLVVGLGNPGTQYRSNRHNAGFLVLDRLAARAGARFRRSLRLSLTCSVCVSGEQNVLAKPRTFMNLSGEAVLELLRHFHLDYRNLMVVYDDFALPLGRIRLRASGSAGGHRGIASIMQAVGAQDVPRLRLGVGEAPPSVEYSDYVLADFDTEELPLLDETLERACLALEFLFVNGLTAAMARFNG
jgi:PTH1 family peptidyl-tRNA hydrolase